MAFRSPGSLRRQVLMGADVALERYEEPKGFSLSIQLSRVDEAERMFGELSANGRTLTPLEKTFWAARFGSVVDRFGLTWFLRTAMEASGAARDWEIGDGTSRYRMVHALSKIKSSNMITR